MDPAKKLTWSTYMENQGPKVWTMSDDIAPSESGDAPRKVIAAATRKKQSQQQPQVQSPKWTKTEPKFDVISGWRMKRSEQVEKLLAKPKPEPDFPLSFLGAGEMAKPKPEGPSIAFSKGNAYKPTTSVKRNAAPMSRPHKRQKKKKKQIVVIDLTGSDGENAPATSSTPLAKDQEKNKEGVVVNLEASDNDDAVEGLSTQQRKEQRQENASIANPKDPDDDVVMEGLPAQLTRDQGQEDAFIADLKEPDNDVVMEDMSTHLAPDDMEDDEEYEEEPWTLDEDEELTRWKLGGHSDDQLDWPSFHESRTEEDLQKRLIWLQGRDPMLWALLKMLEDEEQEKFERELSVEIAEMKARGQLPSSSDEESDDEADEEVNEETDEESDAEV